MKRSINLSGFCRGNLFSYLGQGFIALALVIVSSAAFAQDSGGCTDYPNALNFTKLEFVQKQFTGTYSVEILFADPRDSECKIMGDDGVPPSYSGKTPTQLTVRDATGRVVQQTQQMAYRTFVFRNPRTGEVSPSLTAAFSDINYSIIIYVTPNDGLEIETPQGRVTDIRHEYR